MKLEKLEYLLEEEQRILNWCRQHPTQCDIGELAYREQVVRNREKQINKLNSTLWL